ncbi:MAG: ABC-F family ATP-binding cassette domain-containing protein [Eubacteriales bacterium]
MKLISVDNIQKSYTDKMLLQNVTLHINEGDKIGLIGINGVGKSTLLKIIAGSETYDDGIIQKKSNLHMEYLPQNPDFDDEATVLQQVFKGNSLMLQTIAQYEAALMDITSSPEDPTLQNKLFALTDEMNRLDCWELESQIKTILTKLGIGNYHQKTKELSGGQKKRVALATALITPCDLLILDEPTNHMDNKTIQWLEEYLKKQKCTLLMITHDRYFLDRVVNRTIELDNGQLYSYDGNYAYFMEKKIERQQLQSVVEIKKSSLYKKELEWIRKGAKARTTKQKARIQRFEALKDSINPIEESKIDFTAPTSRLGQKIIELKNISMGYDDKVLIKDFTYTFQRDDCIGILGDNGIGKSTLLNLITEKLPPDKGSIEIGSTVNMGYFSQESEDMDLNIRAIDYIKERAEYITGADGTKISASQMMERFLFTDALQWNFIAKLSGGERRRLQLLKILMDAPNVLLLDEPTNDLDIDTLNILQGYIEDFDGPVITVSHDRYFLDRVCNKIFSFEGNGKILQYTGNYFDYTQEMISAAPSIEKDTEKKEVKSSPKPKIKTKLSFSEQQELNNIDKEIKALEDQLTEIDEDIRKNASNHAKLQELTTLKDEVECKLLDKMEREEYLTNFTNQIK